MMLRNENKLAACVQHAPLMRSTGLIDLASAIV
jgi:hypothetical protein